MILRNRN